MFGRMNPIQDRLIRLMQMREAQGGMEPFYQHPPATPQVPDMMDQSTYIPQGSDEDMLLNEEMGGQPLDYRNHMPYDPEQMSPREGPQMVGGYGAIGNRLERMQATPVHSREELNRRFRRGIPPDVDETTSMMESTSDPLRRAELHDRQHRQMKSHARGSKFGLRRSLSDLKAQKRADDKSAISGSSVDEQFDEVELLRQELNDLKRSMGKK